MATKHQRDSDPLPFVQIDRAAVPKATLLAGVIGVTPQHALGSLVGFWTLNGDPRELEDLLQAGKRELVISADEATIRFELASGKSVDAKVLAAVGLLEKRENGYRVRGMSRFFEPIERRMAKRRAGIAGGEARSNAARDVGGKFTAPTTGGPSAGPLGGGVAGACVAPADPTSNSRQPSARQEPLTSQTGTTHMPDRNHSPTTPEDRGQRTEAASFPVEPGAKVLPIAKADRKPKAPSRQQALFTLLADERRQHLGAAWTPDEYSVQQVNTFLKHIVDAREGGEGYRDAAIVGAFREFLRSEYHATQSPPFRIRQFASPAVFSEYLAKFAASATAGAAS